METLGETRDDAMGEVFDKVGKRLGLPYPQGPQVDELAEKGRPGGAPLRHVRSAATPLDFSYSGLKSQALQEIEKLERGARPDATSAEESRPGRSSTCSPASAPPRCAQVIDRLDRLADRQAAPPSLPSPAVPRRTACFAASSRPGPSDVASASAWCRSAWSGTTPR